MPYIGKKVLPLAAALLSISPFATASVTAEADLSLRTFYFDRDFKDGNTDRTSLTQALRIDTRVNATDMITLGASAFANMKLDGSGDDQSIGTLTSGSNGYAKLGQLYADVAFSEGTTLRLGRWVTSKALLNDNDNRATPPSTQAIKLEGTVGGVTLFGMYSDRASSKTDSDFDKYEDANGDSYGIYLLGASGSINGLNWVGEYGDADDVSEQFYLNASYAFDNGVLLDFYQYVADYGNAHTSKANLDSRLTNLVVQFPITDAVKLALAYQTVGGDTGYDFGWGGENDSYLMTWNAIQYSDFNRQDEDSYQIRVDYKTPIAGLNLMARHVEGEFTAGGVDQEHRETNIDAQYAVSGIEGLNLRARYARVRVETGGEDINELRLIADYSF